MSRIMNIFSGGFHSLLLTDTGELFYAGKANKSSSGLLLHSESPSLFSSGKTSGFTKVPLPFESPILHVSAAKQQNWLICSDGKLWCVGSNNFGQLGLGSDFKEVKQYTQVTTFPKSVRYVSANVGHTLVVLEDGSLWATGCNANGQLGLGVTENKHHFTQVTMLPPNKTITHIATGESASFVVFDDGSLWVAGSNENHYLGLSNSTDYHVFTRVNDHLEGQHIVQVSPGLTSTLLLLKNGQLMGTGQNLYGMLGIGNHLPTTHFTHIDTLPKGKKSMSSFCR